MNPQYLRGIIFVALLSQLAAGCSLTRMRADHFAPGPTSGGTYTTRYTTQLALGNCLVAEPQPAVPEAAPLAAGIGAALLTNAISVGVNRIGAALNEAAKSMTWVAQSYRNIEISTKELEQYRCIQVVRGLFYLDNNAEQSARIRFNDGTTIREEQRKTLWDNGLWLASPPDFLFEGKLYPSENKQAFAVVPQIARLDYPIATRLLRPSKDRSVAVFFGFSPFPEKQRPDLQNSPGASLVLGNLEPGLELRFPTPQADAHKVNRSAYESEWFSFATKASTENDRVPFGISALVTETQDASEFLAFVAAVFQGAKDDITKQLQTAIVPTLAAEARESAQAAKENAQSKYDEAVASAMTALESCMTGTTNLPQLAARARITMRNVNQAARAAGINEKFSDKDFKGTSVTEPDPIKAACKAARDKLP